MSERSHVYPVGEGEPQHDMSPWCWCQPQVEYKDPITGDEVWAHRKRKETEH